MSRVFTPPKPPKYPRGRMNKYITKCPHCKWRVPKTFYCINCGKLMKMIRTTADYNRLDMSKPQRKRKARKKKLEKRKNAKT